MKLLHVSDLHIGKSVNEFSMLKDQEVILEQIIDTAREENVDGVLIAGDVYDRSIPTAEAVAVLDKFLTRLVSGEENEKGIEVYIISGNHDSPERIGFAGKLLEAKGLHIVGVISSEVKKIVKEDVHGAVNVYLLPFAAPKSMKYALQQEDLESDYPSCIKAFTDKMQVNPTERNILVTHHFVVGNGETPILSDSENFLSVGGTEAVDGSVWKDFDYVALGHIHRPQRVGRDTIRYAGSPLKYSFSEVYHKKSMTIVELEEKGNVLIREVPFVPLHDMRIIKGKLSDLLQKEIVQEGNPEDYLQVILTDTEELYEPMEQLRAVYPNVMQLVLEKHIRKEDGMAFTSAKTAKRTTKELFEEFYELVTEQKLSDSQIEMLDSVIEEIGGVERETN